MGGGGYPHSVTQRQRAARSVLTGRDDSTCRDGREAAAAAIEARYPFSTSDCMAFSASVRAAILNSAARTLGSLALDLICNIDVGVKQVQERSRGHTSVDSTVAWGSHISSSSAAVVFALQVTYC